EPAVRRGLASDGCWGTRDGGQGRLTTPVSRGRFSDRGSIRGPSPTDPTVRRREPGLWISVPAAVLVVLALEDLPATFGHGLGDGRSHSDPLGQFGIGDAVEAARVGQLRRGDGLIRAGA